MNKFKNISKIVLSYVFLSFQSILTYFCGHCLKFFFLQAHLREVILFTVPEPPSAVKALVMTGDSILVSWKPPTQPNGVVVQYTVYVKEDGDEAKDVSFM